MGLAGWEGRALLRLKEWVSLALEGRALLRLKEWVSLAWEGRALLRLKEWVSLGRERRAARAARLCVKGETGSSGALVR